MGGGRVVNRIARWNGSQWEDLGGGVTGRSNATSVNTMAMFDDGSGPALFVGGFFTRAGGVVAENLAKWDGQSWSAVGSGMRDLMPWAMGTAGPDSRLGYSLFSGGAFDFVDGVESHKIARLGCPTCRPDCNDDGILNTVDFLCFLNLFSAGDPAADFNGDGVVNTLDFLAFLNAFNEGC